VTRLVGAKLLKLRTTRTFWWLAGSAVGLVLLIVLLSLAIDDEARSAGDVRSLLSNAGIAGLLTLASRCRRRRGRVPARHDRLDPARDTARLRAVSATVLACFLGGLAIGALAAGLGAALEALLRNQVAAVVIVLLLIFVFDPGLSALVEDVGQFTLTGLGIEMSGGEGDTDVLPRGVAALVWALYTVLLAALAALFTARRDI